MSLWILATNADLMGALKPDVRPHWEERIQRVLDSADNAFIPRHEAAGSIVNDQLVMHNGIKVDPLSYYSFPLLKMLIERLCTFFYSQNFIYQDHPPAIKRQSSLQLWEGMLIY